MMGVSMEDKELLARLDERTANIFKLMERDKNHLLETLDNLGKTMDDISKHFGKLNGTVADVCTDMSASKQDRRNMWWVISVCLIGLIGVFVLHFTM